MKATKVAKKKKKIFYKSKKKNVYNNTISVFLIVILSCLAAVAFPFVESFLYE